jgi:hypothetical protein
MWLAETFRDAKKLQKFVGGKVWNRFIRFSIPALIEYAENNGTNECTQMHLKYACVQKKTELFK